MQLKDELNTVKKMDMSVNDYTLKIKVICESLASIGVTVDDDDKVEVCLCGLGPAYKQFKTSIRTRENFPSFVDLIPMLVLEERNNSEDSSLGRNSSEQAIYSNRGRGRGHGPRKWSRSWKSESRPADSNSSKHRIRRDQTQVDVKTIEARGVREVAEISKETMLEMLTGNAGLVVEQVTFKMTVHKEIRVVEDNRITMHRLAGIQIIQKHCS